MRAQLRNTHALVVTDPEGESKPSSNDYPLALA